VFDQANQAIDEYQSKWGAFISQRKNKEFFERLKPTAIGWKTADLAEYDQLLNQWRDACDQIVTVRLNDRWVTKLHLRDTKLHGDIEIIKLMQRRPVSSDAVGLDHLDFYDTEVVNTATVLAEETDVKWSEEENGVSKWVSVWFDNTEAKLRAGTVIDVTVQELQELNQKILDARGIDQ